MYKILVYLTTTLRRLETCNAHVLTNVCLFFFNNEKPSRIRMESQKATEQGSNDTTALLQLVFSNLVSRYVHGMMCISCSVVIIILIAKWVNYAFG